MKKLLNLGAILSLAVLVALAILYFTDYIVLHLWVKYIFLISCLGILIPIYLQFGKRTIFDECIYCLKKARNILTKLNFKTDERILNLSLLKIKNYLLFAHRYMENMYYDYDLHILKKPSYNIKKFSEIITAKNIDEIKENCHNFVETINNYIKLVDAENKIRIQKIKEAKSKKNFKNKK